MKKIKAKILKKIISENDKLYKERKWLTNKYIDLGLSAIKIAKICGVGITTIYRWLKKYDIRIRSRSDAQHLSRGNHCELSIEAIRWLYGELLGDGCLISCSPYSARFSYGSKYKRYAQYISDTLESFGIKISGKVYKQYINKDDCYIYKYKSLSYAELLPIRKKWYPEDKKIVLKDLELTPLTCRQWYIGDGCLKHRKTARPYIVLSTDSFLQEDVNWLIKQLFGLGFKATRQNSNRILISAYSTKNFLKYIGKCPVECYQYKWDYDKKEGV